MSGHCHADWMLLQRRRYICLPSANALCHPLDGQRLARWKSRVNHDFMNSWGIVESWCRNLSLHARHGSARVLPVALGYPTTGFTLERMRSRVEFGFTLLLAMFLLLAPANGILCQQACALCAHPQASASAQGMTMKAPAAAHCSGMTSFASQECFAKAVNCCRTSGPVGATVGSIKSLEIALLSTEDTEAASLLPAMTLASVRNTAPPDVPRSRLIAMRI